MRIALCNRNPADHFGGDLIQCFNYQNALRKLGHEVDYHWELNPDFTGYDYVIFTHLQFGWTNRQYLALKKYNIPYTVVAVWYPGLYSDTTPELVKEICQNAKKIICFSKEEAIEMTYELKLDTDVQVKIVVVPNGVDKDIFSPIGATPDITDKRVFVMSAGRGDDLKQFHLVIEACKELDLPVVIATTKWSQGYIDSLKAIWEKAIILEGLSQEELAKWYRVSKVYVCASRGERNNLCILEAASCGLLVVNFIYNRGKEWLSAPVVDPNVDSELRLAIYNSFERPKNYESEIKSWDEIINMIL